MLTSKMTLRNCALLAVTLISLALTGCVTDSSGSKASPVLNIYQPRVLVLPAGSQIRSEQGLYVPQTREIWHSQAAFRELELQVQDLAAALAQERARK